MRGDRKFIFSAQAHSGFRFSVKDDSLLGVYYSQTGHRNAKQRENQRNEVARKICNIVALYGLTKVKIKLSNHWDAKEFKRELESILRSKELALGSIAQLIDRVYRRRIQIVIKKSGAMYPLRPKATERARAEERKSKPTVRKIIKYKRGRYYCLNLGHTKVTFGVVEITEKGAEILIFERRSTVDLKTVADLKDMVEEIVRRLDERDSGPHELAIGASLSIAEPVISGRVAPNARTSVARFFINGSALTTLRSFRDGLGGLFNEDTFFLTNDSCATGIYAARSYAKYGDGWVSLCGKSVLAVRLGTYSSISFVGPDGYNLCRLNEYSYLSIPERTPLDTISYAFVGNSISYGGLERLAKGRGSDWRSRMGSPNASNAVGIALGSGDRARQTAAARACWEIGIAIGRLALELSGDREIDIICVLGSKSNGIDHQAWSVIKQGIEAEWFRAGSSLKSPCLDFLADSSHVSSTVGAAIEQSERLGLAPE